MRGIQGLTTATGRQTQASGGAWVTSPNALNDVRNAAKKLLTANYPPPYDLIVQPSAYMDSLALPTRE